MKILHFTFYLIVTACMLIIFQSCKKDDHTNAGEYSASFSRHALEYVQLTTFKYLIYKDSASSQLDSVIITTSKLENLYFPGTFLIEFGHYYEEYTLVFTKYTNTSHATWLTVVADASPGIYPNNQTDTSSVILQEQPDYLSVFSLSHTQQSNISMNVEGKNYNNVVMTVSDNHILDTNDPYYKKTITYWAKGIGIIKRSIITSGGAIKTYTLLRNN